MAVYFWCDKFENDKFESDKFILGSIALLSHNTLKWSAILGLSFLCGAGGLGNPCYWVQVHLVNFALHFSIVSK